MRVQFLFLLQIFISCSNGETTLRVRINQKSFTFLASVAKDILQNEVLVLPSQTVSLGSGSADIKNLKVESFESPDITISSVAPDGLVISTNDGSVVVSGSWEASYRILWTMHISGDLSLKINGFKTFTRINLVPKSGKLQLHFKECQLKLGNLNLQLYGGLGAWIANHFTGGAQESIKKALQQEICGNMEDRITQINKQLWSMQAQINVIDNVYLSHRLLENLKATENFIQLDFSVYATFGQSKCYLQPKKINNQQIVSNHMAVLWFGEPMINCYLKTWYETLNHYPMHIANSTNNRQFREFLNVNCTKSKNCTGKVSDPDTNYRNQSIDLDIYLIKAPLLHAENGVYLGTSMKIIFYQSPKNSNTLELKELTVYTESLLNITISQRKFNIRTEKVKISTIEENDSKIENLNQIILDGLTNVVIYGLKELKLWEYTVNVSELALSRLTLSNKAIFTGINNFIRADLDFSLSNQ